MAVSLPAASVVSNALGFLAPLHPRLRPPHAAWPAVGAARPRHALCARPIARASDSAQPEPAPTPGVRRRAEPDGRAARAAAGRDRAAAFALWTKAGWHPDDADDAHDTEVVVARDRQGRVVGAGRIARSGQNVEIGRVFILEEFRGRGFGRMLVEKLMELAAPIRGALHVQATRDELGFYSILGFETQGNEYMLGNDLCRHMVYRVPMCAPSTDCVGLHHTVRCMGLLVAIS
jgi:predicted GNAT family N-acyltransferase